MKGSKFGICVVLIGCITTGTVGCGIFDFIGDLVSVGTAAAKLFGGEANAVTANEWEALSGAAATAAGNSNLALSNTESAAVAAFLSQNNINDLSSIDSAQGLQGLDELAAAFQERAGDEYDLTTQAGADQFFEDYGEELAQGLEETLAELGIDLP